MVALAIATLDLRSSFEAIDFCKLLLTLILFKKLNEYLSSRLITSLISDVSIKPSNSSLLIITNWS